MTNNSYTPATIDRLFAIPIYQRLFEWDEAQVSQLLNDLYSAFKKDNSVPYYIGMLTAFKGNTDDRYSLVDGQQRFTVLMLLGIVFHWRDLVEDKDGRLRLTFFARKRDEEYLRALIENNGSIYTNNKIRIAIDCIQKYTGSICTDEVELFKNYVREQTTFFISELPDNYTLQDLNRYFEAMNEAGKGLENHEILKVKLLKEVLPEKQHEYTVIWNTVSEMDKRLDPLEEKEKQEDYKKGSHLNNGNSHERFSSIRVIPPNPIKPEEKAKEASEQAILSFTDFLLQVLWLCMSKNSRVNSTDFFNRNKLLTTFDTYIKQLQPFTEGETVSYLYVDIDHFFRSLLNYRLLFDYYIIKQTSKDQGSVTYLLNHIADDQSYEEKRSLIQYQSMLLVSTESYIWLTPFLFMVASKEMGISDCLEFLQAWDNERQTKDDISLNYGSIKRYWFWRLDYYLWQNPKKYFNDERSRSIAEKYVFRVNRSIEHIAPQQPKSGNHFSLRPGYLHVFGNLAMISSGQNSSLQNESFEVKRAHVESFVNESVGGSIQSLKMLKAYEFDTWNEENLKKHHNEMVQILIDSFDEQTSPKIIAKLKDQLLSIHQLQPTE